MKTQEKAVSKRYSLLGIPVDAVDFDTMLVRMDEIIAAGQGSYFFPINPIKCVLIQTNSRLAATARNAALNFPDAAGIVWALRLLYGVETSRVPGYEFLHHALRHAAEKNYRVYLLGARHEVMQESVAALRQLYPGVNIVGWHHGYLSNKETEQAALQEIQDAHPDVVFVGMGAVRQDRFIDRVLRETHVPFAMGVGGSFDVIAGAAPRAPKLLLDHGLEWLYRLILQPWRIRPMINLPRFVWLVIKEKYWRRSYI